MIHLLGVFLLCSMLGISIFFQNFAMNQQYECKSAILKNCTKVFYDCEFFFENLSKKNRCCPNIDCFCDDFSKYNFQCNFLYVDHYSFEDGYTVTLLAGIVLTVLSSSSIFNIRRYFLKQMNLTKKEIIAIDTNTRGFKKPEEKMDFLLAKEKLLNYKDESIEKNKIRIRAIDFFGRKSFHFISMLIFTYFPIILLEGSPLPTYSGVIIYSFIEFLCGCIIWNWYLIPKRSIFAPIFLGGHNRIQDGYSSLKNVSTALFVGCIRTLITAAFYLYIQKDLLLDFGKKNFDNYNSIQKFFFLIWILNNNGVSFGDTAGEGVGAFLGKHRFKVRGFSGQENERSVEGCMGVFLFTGISDIIAIFSCSDLFNIYSYETSILVFFLCVTTTFFEMISFKGTDNLTICLSNEITIYIWLLWIKENYS